MSSLLHFPSSFSMIARDFGMNQNDHSEVGMLIISHIDLSARTCTYMIAAVMRKNHLHPAICPPFGMSVTKPPNSTPIAPAIEPESE